MSSGQRFSGYTSTFGYATGQTMTLRQMQMYQLMSNNTKPAKIPAGLIDPAAYTLPRSKPVFNGRTPDLLTLLTTLSLVNGKCFDEASTFWLQERADCGTFLTGATHSGLRTQKGFMFIDNITCEQESPDGAMASVVFIALKKAGSVIVERLTAQDISAVSTPTYVSNYFLASPYENSVEIPGVMGITITPTINFQPAPASPGTFDSIGAIVTRGFQMSYRCLKTDEFDATAITGRALTSSYAFYLQKADSTNSTGDGRVSAASSAHIKISCTAGDVEVRDISVDGNSDAMSEVIIRPTGTPSISLTSTIP